MAFLMNPSSIMPKGAGVSNIRLGILMLSKENPSLILKRYLAWCISFPGDPGHRPSDQIRQSAGPLRLSLPYRRRGEETDHKRGKYLAPALFFYQLLYHLLRFRHPFRDDLLIVAVSGIIQMAVSSPNEHAQVGCGPGMITGISFPPKDRAKSAPPY